MQLKHIHQILKKIRKQIEEDYDKEHSSANKPQDPKPKQNDIVKSAKTMFGVNTQEEDEDNTDDEMERTAQAGEEEAAEEGAEEEEEFDIEPEDEVELTDDEQDADDENVAGV